VVNPLLPWRGDIHCNAHTFSLCGMVRGVAASVLAAAGRDGQPITFGPPHVGAEPKHDHWVLGYERRPRLL